MFGTLARRLCGWLGTNQVVLKRSVKYAATVHTYVVLGVDEQRGRRALLGRSRTTTTGQPYRTTVVVV